MTEKNRSTAPDSNAKRKVFVKHFEYFRQACTITAIMLSTINNENICQVTSKITLGTAL